MCQEFLEQAWEAKFNGDNDGAIALFHRCLECDPLSAEAHRELGLLYYGFKRNSLEAARFLQTSLILKETSDGHFFLALVMEKLGSKNEARSEFLSALRGYNGDTENPVHALAQFHYGEFLAVEGNFPEAEKHMKKALSIDPECEQIKKGYEHLQECMDTSTME